MGRNRNKKRRPQGFSEGPLRPFTNLIFQGKDKRRSLNQMATIIALGIGVLGGVLGASWFGCVGAGIGFIVGCAVGGAYVTKRRFYR